MTRSCPCIEALESRTLLSTIDVSDNAGFARYGLVFNDLNGDGVQQSAEPALAGRAVNIRWSLTSQIRSTVTDSLGQFIYSSSDKAVELAPRRGWRATMNNFKPDDFTFRPSDGAPPYDTVLGVTQRALVSGILANDLNGNGKRESDEPIVGQWKVYVDSNDNKQLDADERSVLTDRKGRWSFYNLPAGTYVIRAELTDSSISETRSINVTVARGQESKGHELGIHAAAANGFVFNDLNGNARREADEALLAGWRVFDDANNNRRLDAGEIYSITDSNGFWSLGALPSGDHVFRCEARAAWPATLARTGHVRDLEPGQLAAHLDFGQRGVKISGFVRTESYSKVWSFFSGGPAQIFVDINNNGVKDHDEPNSTSDPGSGQYKISAPAGTYALRVIGSRIPSRSLLGTTPQLTTWFTTFPSNQAYRMTLQPGETRHKRNFILQGPITITGRVFLDDVGDGIFHFGDRTLYDWRVYIDENENGIFDLGESSAISKFDGMFEINDIRPGTHVVRAVSRAGYIVSTGIGGDHSITSTQSGQDIQLDIGVTPA